jgi:hypothetical protein
VDSHLQARDYVVRPGSLLCASCRWNRRPKQAHPSAQSSYASMGGASAGLPHPLAASDDDQQWLQKNGLGKKRAGAATHICSVCICESKTRPDYRLEIKELSRQGPSTLTTPGAAHLPCTNVLILKPNVGLTLMMSSPLSFLRIVVLPALSNPLFSGLFKNNL